eukprot:scaffold53853_cov17-Prasinocladus_malaysianus.AAC.1
MDKQSMRSNNPACDRGRLPERPAGPHMRQAHPLRKGENTVNLQLPHRSPYALPMPFSAVTFNFTQMD